jgi:hypothetical protein
MVHPAPSPEERSDDARASRSNTGRRRAEVAMEWVQVAEAVSNIVFRYAVLAAGFAGGDSLLRFLQQYVV